MHRPLALLVSMFFNREQHRLRAAVRIGVTTLLLLVAFALAVSTVDATRSTFLQHFAGEVLVAPLSLLVLWAGIRALDRRSMHSRGFRWGRAALRELTVGLALGAGLMTGVFVVAILTDLVTVTGALRAEAAPFSVALSAQLARFTAVGFYEEAIFRGYLLTNLAEGLPIRNRRHALMVALLFSSILFGLMHLGNPGATVVGTGNIVLAGIFLGLGYILTGGLAFPIGVHITWNFVQGNVFGFPVSGTDPGPTLVSVSTSDAVVWTGGRFGPEGGLLGTGAVLLGCTFLWWWSRRRQSKSSSLG